MNAVDDRLWLSDELWAQIRPPRARLQITASVAVVVLVAVSVAAWYAGIFHSQLDARPNIAAARGDVLAMTVELANDSNVAVHITGVRDHQQGVEFVGADLAAAPADSAVTTKLPALTIPADGSRHITVYYRIDCGLIKPPLRLQIGTSWLVGHQTVGATLSGAAVPALRQLCPSSGF